MLVKLAVAGALSLALLPPVEFPPTIYVEHPYVEKLSRNGGSGTGFKLKDGRWASVDHVTSIGGCRLDGKPITVLHADPNGDFSIFTVEDNRRGGLEINCQGFDDRTWYWGIGHGRGDPWPQMVSGRYSAFFTLIGSDRWAILEGNRYVPGMSGGPVLDQSGRVVGTVNAFGLAMRISFSRPLQDTILCQDSTSAQA